MRKGVFAVVAASFLYGIMPVFTKAVLDGGMPSESVVFYRLLFSALISLAILAAGRKDISPAPGRLLHLAFFGIVGMGATMALLTASYRLIPTGLATMIHFSYPLFVTLAMALFFGEKPTAAKATACLLAFRGLGLTADFSVLSPAGIIMAAASGLCYASYVLANRKSRFAGMPSLTIVFYVCAFSSVFFGIRARLSGKLVMIPNAKSLFLLIAISLFCTVGALSLLNYGIKDLGPAPASVLNMLEPVVSLVAGAIIYSERLGARGLAGCALVALCGIITALDSRRRPEKVKVHVNTERLTE